MPMRMKYDLPGGGEVVLHTIEAGRACCGHKGFAEFGQDGHNFVAHFNRQIQKRFVMPFGDDEQVAFGDGVDVEKCKDVVVFIYARAGKLAFHNSAEDTRVFCWRRSHARTPLKNWLDHAGGQSLVVFVKHGKASLEARLLYTFNYTV